MDKGIVVPLALFFAVVYGLKLLVDARMRYLFFKAGTPEVVHSLFKGEEDLRRSSNLRSGILLVALASGLSICASAQWQVLSVHGVAVMLAAGGVGNLVAYWLGAKLKRPN
jgi:hypothetical protein